MSPVRSNPARVKPIDVVAVITVLATGLACSGRAQEPVAEDDRVEELVDALAAAYCEAGSMCCGAAQVPVNDQCERDVAREFSERIADLRRSGDVALDEYGARRCLAEVKWNRGRCAYDLFPHVLVPGEGELCGAVLRSVHGAAPGEPCVSDADCAPAVEGSTCSRFGNERRCALCVELGEGDDPRIDGKDCSADSQCVSGFCDSEVGFCMPRLGCGFGGERCAVGDDCLSGECEDPGICATLMGAEAMVNGRTCAMGSGR